MGVIVPSGIATGDNNKKFFVDIRVYQDLLIGRPGIQTQPKVV